MAAVKHSPEFAKKVGVPQSVGHDFTQADRGGKFDRGGYPHDRKAKAKGHGRYGLPRNA